MKKTTVSEITLTLLLAGILLMALDIQAVSIMSPETDWLDGWSYRKSHIINSGAGAGINYQMRIKAHYDNGIDGGRDVYLDNHCRTDFGDVRFTDDDKTTLLDYWIESKVDSDNAIFWVEVTDDLGSSNVTIYIYYGNSGAPSASNGANTFLLFDHFDDNDHNSWNEAGTGTVIESGTTITITTSGPRQSKWIYSGSTFPFNRRAIFLAKFSFIGLNDAGEVGFENPERTNRIVGNKYMDPYYPEFRYYVYSPAISQINSGIDRDTAYHIFRIMKISSSSCKFQMDDEDVLDLTTNIPIADLNVCMQNYDGGDTIVDYVFVTKYVDPEPQHGTWGGACTHAFPDLVGKKAWPSYHHFVEAKHGSINVLYARIKNPNTIGTFEVYVRFSAYDAKYGLMAGSVVSPTITLLPIEMADVAADFDINAPEFLSVTKAYVLAELFYLDEELGWVESTLDKWISFAIIRI